MYMLSFEMIIALLIFPFLSHSAKVIFYFALSGQISETGLPNVEEITSRMRADLLLPFITRETATWDTPRNLAMSTIFTLRSLSSCFIR